MKKVYIKSSRCVVKINYTDDVMEQAIQDKFLYAYIPSVQIPTSIQNSRPNATINLIKSSQNKVDFNYPKVDYYYKSVDTKSIITIIEYVLERARQEKGIICVHGAGAIVNNNAVVCWGPATGMGKTTLALELSKNSNEFYSDEKVLIDLNSFKTVGRIKEQYLSNNHWKQKYGNSPYYEHNNISNDIEYNIKLFVYGIICQDEYYTLDEWNESKFFWHLYEESCRKIRGTSRLLFGFSYPVPSLDTQALATKRILAIKKFTKYIKSIYYKGNIINATKLINNYLYNGKFE